MYPNRHIYLHNLGYLPLNPYLHSGDNIYSEELAYAASLSYASIGASTSTSSSTSNYLLSDTSSTTTNSLPVVVAKAKASNVLRSAPKIRGMAKKSKRGAPSPPKPTFAHLLPVIKYMARLPKYGRNLRYRAKRARMRVGLEVLSYAYKELIASRWACFCIEENILIC